LNKAIDTFYKKGLFIRVARGVYMADPELFARGKWEDIRELRLVIDYVTDDNGRTTKKLKSDLSESVQLRLGL
jgi:DNA primase